MAPRGFSRRRGTVRASLDADELMALMHGSDPVRVELTRLENELRGELLIRPCCFALVFSMGLLRGEGSDLCAGLWC